MILDVKSAHVQTNRIVPRATHLFGNLELCAIPYYRISKKLATLAFSFVNKLLKIWLSYFDLKYFYGISYFFN